MVDNTIMASSRIAAVHYSSRSLGSPESLREPVLGETNPVLPRRSRGRLSTVADRRQELIEAAFKKIAETSTAPVAASMARPSILSDYARPEQLSTKWLVYIVARIPRSFSQAERGQKAWTKTTSPIMVSPFANAAIRSMHGVK